MNINVSGSVETSLYWRFDKGFQNDCWHKTISKLQLCRFESRNEMGADKRQ
jgi:hypothetical protein